MSPAMDSDAEDAGEAQIWSLEAERWGQYPSPVVPLLMGMIPQEELGNFLFFLHRLSRNEKTRGLLMRMLRDPQVDVSQVVQFLWDNWNRHQDAMSSSQKGKKGA